MSQTAASPVVGIDLGTTYSLVAWVDTTGHPVTVINADGDLTTPSVVFFDRTGVIVGKEAIKAAEFEPERVARFAKRDMGRVAFHKSIRGEPLPPEVIQAVVLQRLKQEAELKLGKVKQAVITVPAYFDEPRRKATEDAGRLAGLEVLDILNEPTAAAISYGVQQGFIRLDGQQTAREVVLVYDLGGGTFDVTLMEIEGRKFSALATAGDVYLGGVDWTDRIVDYIGEQFMKQFAVDPRVDECALQILTQQAEDAKRSLTAREEVTIMSAFDGHRLRTSLTRAQFEEMTGDLIDRTTLTVRKVLREAKLQWSDISRLLLVGGSSRMPAVQRTLEAESGLKVDRSLSPDEAVGHGAAIYAALLSGNQTDGVKDIVVRNVNSHDLGILGKESGTGRDRRKVMIPRNTPLPCTSRSTFKTFRDNQPSVVVNVVEGGDASGNSATRIGKCSVTDLPPLPAQTPVEVTFKYAANGRISVTAYLPTIDKQAALTIDRASGLDEAALQHWQSRIDEGLTDASLQASKPVASKSASASVDASASVSPAAVPAEPQPQSAPTAAAPATSTPATVTSAANQPATTPQPLPADTAADSRPAPVTPASVEEPPQPEVRAKQGRQKSGTTRSSAAVPSPDPAAPVSNDTLPSVAPPVPEPVATDSRDSSTDAARIAAPAPQSIESAGIETPSISPVVAIETPTIEMPTIVTSDPSPITTTSDFNSDMVATGLPVVDEPLADLPSVALAEPPPVAVESVHTAPEPLVPETIIDSPLVEMSAAIPPIDEPSFTVTTTPQDAESPLASSSNSVAETTPAADDGSIEAPTPAAAEQKPQPSKRSREQKQPSSGKVPQDEATSDKVAPPALQVDDAPHELTEEEIRRQRLQTAEAFGVTVALHAAVLIALWMIVLPPQILDDAFKIVSAMSTDEIPEEPLENIDFEQPQMIDDQTLTQVETDVITNTDNIAEVDFNDFEPSIMAVEAADSGASAVAPITGEMGGRSKAGRAAMVTKYGGTAESEAAVGLGLSWLKRHQLPNGSWSFDHRNPECDGTCEGGHGTFAKSNMGATGLALLAYMGSGSSYTDGEYQETIEAGLKYLLANTKATPQGADMRGSFEGNSGMYIQGICTICMTEAAAMNEMAIKMAKRTDKRIGVKARSLVVDDTKLLKAAAQGAIAFIVNAQHSAGGWRYNPGQAGDTSVVGWQVMGLYSGRSINLVIPKNTFLGVESFLDSVQGDGGATYGYEGPGNKPSTTAIGLLCRMYGGWKRDHPAIKRGVAFLSKTKPAPADMYYNYYATQVMHHYGGEEWTKWNDVMREQLVKTQHRSGHAAGSWDIRDAHGGPGGRLYMTCLATMTLEVYYRHLPLYEHLEGQKVAGR